MHISTLNFTVVSSPKTKFSDAQILLEGWTGKKFSRNEADQIWVNITKHKWNVSQKLGRDIGFRIATIDFIDNFYRSDSDDKGLKKIGNKDSKVVTFLRGAFRRYFQL